MSKNEFKRLRDRASKDFKAEPQKRLLAKDAVSLAEEWLNSKNLTYDYVTSGISDDQTKKYKAELKEYVKAGLWKRRKEGRYGLLGSFLLAVAFAVMVQLIARWIINNFFD